MSPAPGAYAVKEGKGKGQGRTQGDALFALAVFVTAALVRIAYLFEIKDVPFFPAPVVDAGTYFQHAEAIASGLLLSREAFWQAPLYPYVLAVLIWLFGPHHLLLHLLHLLLGAFNCVLIYWLGTRVTGRGPALLAAMAAAFYAPFIFFEGEYLRPVLIVFLNILLLLAFLRAAKSLGLWAALGAGLLCGLAALARPNILLFLPLAMVWFAWVHSPALPGKALAARLALIAAGACASVAPATIHNAVTSGELIPLTSNTGANFYIGNSLDRERTLCIRPALEWADLMAEPYRHGYTSPGQRSDYFLNKALQDIASEPLSWVRAMAVKTWRLFHGHEYARNVDLYFFRDYSLVLKALLWKRVVAFPYGVLVPFALVGFLLFAKSREPGKVLIALYAAVYSASVILFFIAARYRVPLIPAFLLFASYALFWIVKKFRQRDYRRGLAAMVLILAAFAGCNLRLHGPEHPAYETHLLLGNALAKQGRFNRALDEYERAMALAPGLPDPFFQAGVLMYRRDRMDEAGRMFQKTMRMTEKGGMAHAWSHQYLGHMARKQGDLKRAVSHYQSSLAAFSFQFEARLYLGLALQEMGETDRAEREFLILKDQYPGYPEPWRALAELYSRQGRRAEAGRYLQRARQLSPGSDF